jgi:hypothetical protein
VAGEKRIFVAREHPGSGRSHAVVISPGFTDARIAALIEMALPSSDLLTQRKHSGLRWLGADRLSA